MSTLITNDLRHRNRRNRPGPLSINGMSASSTIKLSRLGGAPVRTGGGPGQAWRRETRSLRLRSGWRPRAGREPKVEKVTLVDTKGRAAPRSLPPPQLEGDHDWPLSTSMCSAITSHGPGEVDIQVRNDVPALGFQAEPIFPWFSVETLF